MQDHLERRGVMRWHTSMTTRDELDGLVRDIRRQGGTVASCQRRPVGFVVTWFTT